MEIGFPTSMPKITTAFALLAHIALVSSRPCKTHNPLFLNEVLDISDGQILRVSIYLVAILEGLRTAANGHRRFLPRQTGRDDRFEAPTGGAVHATAVGREHRFGLAVHDAVDLGGIKHRAAVTLVAELRPALALAGPTLCPLACAWPIRRRRLSRIARVQVDPLLQHLNLGLQRAQQFALGPDQGMAVDHGLRQRCRAPRRRDHGGRLDADGGRWHNPQHLNQIFNLSAKPQVRST